MMGTPILINEARAGEMLLSLTEVLQALDVTGEPGTHLSMP